MSFGHIFTTNAQKRLFRNFRSKICRRHSLRRPRFPIRQMHFHYQVTFTGYIFDVLVLLRRVTLWPWPLTFWPWECLMYSSSHVWPTYQFLLSYDYWLLSYECWIFDYISVIWNSHCACAVSRDLSPGGKNDPHFWNLLTQFTYSLCHFYGATTKIKPCYRRKIAFSHCEGYKVYCACAVSRDLCIVTQSRT